MTRPVSNPAASPTTRRPWRRYFLQFSLRTLLGLTTLSALGCWWFLQPKTHEEQLAGKYLTLRRQVKLLAQPAVPAGMFSGQNPGYIAVTQGRWQLHDEHGNVLVAGRALDDQPHGRWTIYHPNGRKAAAGQMDHGLRTGTWQTWNDAGQLESEVSYAVVKQIIGPASPETIQAAGPLVRIVPRLQVGGFKKGQTDDQIRLPDLSQRHGPTRFWHSDGQLKCEGNFDRDLREGPWTFFDEQGRATARGDYHVGHRDGPWLIRNVASGQTETVEYIADRPRAEFDRLIADLKQEITSGDLHRQITAMHWLDDLGIAGQPLLTELLAESADVVKLMALRRLKSLWQIDASGAETPPQALAEVTLARLEALTKSSDPRLAEFAGFWLYQLSPAHRDSLYDGLIATVGQSRDQQWQEEVLRTLWNTDDTHWQTTFEAIAHAQHLAPAPYHSMLLYCGTGMSSAPRYSFLELALNCDGLATLIKSAIKSPDARVRRFAIMLIDQIAVRASSSAPAQMLNDGSGRIQFIIPAEFEQAVEDAKNDPDPHVRQEAEQAGKWSPPVVG